MKIPTDRIDLGELGYKDYWVEMPRSMKQGYLQEFAAIGSNGTDENDAEVALATNVKMLELISAWNIDDDNGKVLPLPSKLRSKAEKEKVVAELPVDVLVHIAQRMAGTVKVSDQTKDF